MNTSGNNPVVSIVRNDATMWTVTVTNNLAGSSTFTIAYPAAVQFTGNFTLVDTFPHAISGA